MKKVKMQTNIINSIDIKRLLQAESINQQIKELEKKLNKINDPGVKLIIAEMIKEAKKIKKKVEEGKIDLDNMENDDETKTN